MDSYWINVNYIYSGTLFFYILRRYVVFKGSYRYFCVRYSCHHFFAKFIYGEFKMKVKIKEYDKDYFSDLTNLLWEVVH